LAVTRIFWYWQPFEERFHLGASNIITKQLNSSVGKLNIILGTELAPIILIIHTKAELRQLGWAKLAFFAS
jgi:hypothetical protein